MIRVIEIKEGPRFYKGQEVSSVTFGDGLIREVDEDDTLYVKFSHNEYLYTLDGRFKAGGAILPISLSPKDTVVEVPMSEMKPLEIGRLGNGNLVMRTQTIEGLEVMDLSSPGPGYCWTDGLVGDAPVTLLPKGTRITLEITE